MMQVVFDKVIHMIAVRDRLVSAFRPMNMAGLVPSAMMLGCTVRGICRGDLDSVFFDAVTADVLQMAFAQIVNVSVVLYTLMAASRAVNMGVTVLPDAGLVHHIAPSSNCRAFDSPLSIADLINSPSLDSDEGASVKSFSGWPAIRRLRCGSLANFKDMATLEPFPLRSIFSQSMPEVEWRFYSLMGFGMPILALRC
jgi:hypothetical protein